MSDSEEIIPNNTYSQRKSKDQSKKKGKLKLHKVKEEMQTLYLSSDLQKQIMNTLKYIHGPNFVLDDITQYKNKKSRFKDNFWVDTGNLIIKSAYNYAINDNNNGNKDDPELIRSELRRHSFNKLKSYGFHESHILEVLSYFNDDTEEALQFLFYKYHNIDSSKFINDHGLSREELLQQRIEEKDVLISIYETAFEEKITNQIWILTFSLDYLIEFYRNRAPNQKPKLQHESKSKKEKCRNWSRTGQCKFGDRCRFSHEIEIKKPSSEPETCKFNLEIRFSLNSQYPYEPPLILLTTDFALIPKTVLFYICHRLLDEAIRMAEYGIVSVYSICELLHNSEEIINFLNQTKFRLPEETEQLLKIDEDLVEDTIDCSLSTHYEKRIKNSKQISNKDIQQQDLKIVKEFSLKLANPKYKAFLEKRRTLPAWNKKDDILNTMEKSQVIVISGETGCGKSTQIPQYILDNWLSNYNTKHIEIICTQPRRLSAIGVAERVASERVESIGHTVGYQIRLETKISAFTRLTFCTTGILLMRLQSDPYLSSVTHVIVDEVHERSDESDFLLLILRKILQRRSDLKVILMSATLNANLFSEYFGGIPVIDIPGRTFPVQQYYLEDILEEIDYVSEENSQYTRKDIKTDELLKELAAADVLKDNKEPPPNMKDEKLSFAQVLTRYHDYSQLTCKNIFLNDPEKINFELVESILLWIVNGVHDYPKTGTILVFLPGYAEISALLEYLSNNFEFSPRQNNFILLPLHSSLSNEEQAAIFRKPKNGARKIILSTNIAETSITIDDCVFVIDCGKMKEKRFDSNKNMESLDTVWISKANAMQRRGRAGRVMPGVCIHLYTSYQYAQFIGQPVPELHRIPLEQIILRIKILPNTENDAIHDVLSNTLEPPSTENIASSIYRLQDVGALDEEEELTPLGHHLAALPVDVRIGKLMLFGAILCCVDSALTIAACLSYKSPFKAQFLQKKEIDAKKKEFIVANSDQLTVLKAYKKWKSCMERGSYAGYNFAQENYLSQRTLLTIADIKHQFLELLASIGFIPSCKNIFRRPGQDKVLEMIGPQLNENGENARLLAGVLCAALYPNVVKVLTPGKSYQKCIGGALPTTPDHEHLKFVTLEDGPVAIHPSSVNSKVGSFPSPYLIYQEKVKTSRIFVRETCMVPPLPLTLFAGCDLHIEVHSGTSILLLDEGWIIFKTESHEVAEMLKAIRIELNKILEEKIKDPYLNLLHHNNGRKIISTIVNVITSIN